MPRPTLGSGPRLLLALGAAALLTGAHAAPPPVQAGDLVGLWGAEHSFGPSVRGSLTIDGRSRPWRAAISGYDVAVTRSGDSVSLRLPGDRGAFRGWLGGSAGGAIAGHWIQPPPLTRGVRYASPVRLGRVSEGVWRGRVRPLEDRLSVYLVVRRDTAGQVRAFMRNPELNLGMGRPFRVTARGRRVLLVDANDASDTVGGVYRPETGRLSLRLPNVGATLEFTRRDSADAPGYYPRTPPRTEYVYRTPVALRDGWATASLGEAGLDPGPVDSLMERLLAQPTTGYTSPYPQGLLVARHGKLVLEEYLYGFGPDRMHDTRSAGKTFAPLLVGIARDRGKDLDPGTTLAALFSEYRPLAHDGPRKEAITVADLMSMTSGLSCDDNDSSSPGAEDRMQTQSAVPDWYRYTLDLPMARAPGGYSAVYCTAGINLLGGLVRDATGRWLPDFFREFVAGPLQFRGYHMNLMPTGEAYVGGGLFLRPRDLLKLGQLYLDGGTWNGRRVVSREWVERSTREHSRFSPDDGYGYGWHLHTFDVSGRSVREYAASGNGGQFAMVFPDLDMVVVMTGGNYGNYPTWRRFQDLVVRYLVPAALPGAGSVR